MKRTMCDIFVNDGPDEDDEALRSILQGVVVLRSFASVCDLFSRPLPGRRNMSHVLRSVSMIQGTRFVPYASGSVSLTRDHEPRCVCLCRHRRRRGPLCASWIRMAYDMACLPGAICRPPFCQPHICAGSSHANDRLTGEIPRAFVGC